MMVVMPAGVAATARGVRRGVHGGLMGLMMCLHVLLMRGLMHVQMLGVNGLLLLLSRVQVAQRWWFMRRPEAWSGIADDRDKDAGERQTEENHKEFHGREGLGLLWV